MPRNHHCPGCYQTMDRSRCELKDHVYRCQFHPNRYLKIGAECPTYKVERISKERAELKEEKEKEKENPKKEVKPKKEPERKYGKW
ncbi:uncharacterized protein LAJ45_05436 [Morchella importuna]|uniref:Uncharacterized protein n=1 Tax=Morchella conica CCBAS932 TaxID=1392247 RepID=A0A3N4KBB8_9PEZI|nr:uncharacterized protein LAJ45_05436 [Morchella importuna]KAH8150740.1 hypothetical protein LAJ45_05436 [Morchella importuna]RPB07807.1 hypothetical protein P167DRAFT_578862 [Morchella conica CCBAS932]